MEEDKIDLYNMELHAHEYINNGNIKIVRVPGGWIYISYFDGVTSVFVPFNNEFMSVSNGQLVKGAK
jgi:hypothetical protein